MSSDRPSPEFVSLLHHIELTNDNWWDEALQQSIIAVLLVVPSGFTRPALHAALAEHLKVPIDWNRVESAIDALIANAKIVSLSGRLTILQTARMDYESAKAEQARLEAQFSDHVATMAARYVPHLPFSDVYDAFLSKFLLPTVQQLGAATWTSIISDRFSIDFDSSPYRSFANVFDALDEHALRALCLATIDPQFAVVRQFVLRLLTAYFFVETLGYRQDFYDKLEKLLHALHWTLVLDSTVLLPILRPEQRAGGGSPGDDLGEAVRDYPFDYRISLWVTPATLNELTADIDSILGELDGGQPRQLSRESERRQLEVRRWLSDRGRPRDWLQRTSDRLEAVLSRRGVNLMRQPTPSSIIPSTAARSDLADLIPRIGQFASRKSVNEWMHDVFLWHLVEGKRGPFGGSTLETDSWLVTDDPELLAFDRIKSETTGSRIVCAHPFAVSQVLRLFVTRDQLYEDAYSVGAVSALRIPLHTRSLDQATERVALRIEDSLDWWETYGGYTESEALIEELIHFTMADTAVVHRDFEAARKSILDRRALIEEEISGAEQLMFEMYGDSMTDEQRLQMREVFSGLQGRTVNIVLGDNSVAGSQIYQSGVGHGPQLRLSDDDFAALQEIIAYFQLESDRARSGVETDEQDIDEHESVIEALDALRNEVTASRRRTISRSILRGSLLTLFGVSQGVGANALYGHGVEILSGVEHLLHTRPVVERLSSQWHRCSLYRTTFDGVLDRWTDGLVGNGPRREFV